ncbi:MAG: histone deacetylase [Thermodesulfobacteriota bacterium]
MIIYDENQTFSLLEFGIKIPVRNSRTVNTYAALKSHPVLGSKIDRWRLPRSEDKVSRKDLLRVHSPAYVNKLFSPDLEREIIRTYELIDRHGKYYRYDPEIALLPLSELFDRILERVAGTVQCCRVALDKGFCFYFGGGMHHAQADYGNGFCPLNDMVIAVRKLQAEGRIRTAWIIDVDAHKGDGTAALTQGDDSIQTLSIHMARGWPLDEAEYDDMGRLNPSFIPSDIDIPIDAGEEDQYAARLEAGLHRLAEGPLPDLALVVSGADPYEHDELPSTRSLRLTLDQMLARDRLVYTFLKERHIPKAYVMAGGYGERAWEVYARFLTWALLDTVE